ncbi:ABC transporter substrate-binding protein [Lachnospiraceae bacterium 48-42]
MMKRTDWVRTFCLLVLAVVMLSVASAGCGRRQSEEPEPDAEERFSFDAKGVKGMTLASQLEPEYAEGFRIYYYKEGFRVIDVKGSASYLVVPQGKEVPGSLPEGMVVLKKPLDRIYVAGTATMAMFNALGGLDQVGFSSLKAEDWYVEAAREAMEAGKIQFAGKYSEPDYEMLVEEGCSLAVESQMILHSPKVMEQLEMMGVPVLIDCSSNEEHPLGRVEWILVYGVLLDKEEEAEAFFQEQTKVMDELEEPRNTEQTVAYFYINSNGQAVVRTGTDYIAKMIEIAGGRYPFSQLGDGKKSTMVITMEEFYTTCADADYIIYNASIDNKLTSIGELTAKDEILKNMKAVKEGNVFCTDKDFYQAADIASRMISDIHLMLTDGKEEDMAFLYRVEK